MRHSKPRVMLCSLAAFLICAAQIACSSSSDSSPAGAQGGTGGSGGVDVDSGGGTGGASEAGPETGNGGTAGDGGAAGGGGGAACDSLQEGWNKGFMVDGLSRDFLLHLPDHADSAGPFPVIFNWHGLGDTASNMDGMIASWVNKADFPFIGVTPEDSNYSLMGNAVDWDVFQVNGATNREARLFDEILACLQKKYKVDDTHIHSMGFSLGSIVTDMLGTVRGDKLASLVTYSGAYFSNQADVATLGALSSMVTWPAPTHSNAYGQIILFGGTSDTYPFGPITVHFDTFAQNDADYLNGLKHDVVLCNHGQGHSAPAPGFDTAQIIEFFKVHPKGVVDSPFAAALPGDYPPYCSFKAKQ